MMHTITLVGDVHVSKTEALQALSALLDTPINDSDPSNAVLNLRGGVVLSIEVPKFGEDLPLTVDLSSDDREALEKVAQDFTDCVGQSLSWSMTEVGT